ncbi:SAM-dependent methyltransferase [Actinophytocola sp.]|uniref:SAM-dependent methyltransferase n=1 Tax=Actinophytocola sp. TaxID=1872138 RepID=UPI002ED20F24
MSDSAQVQLPSVAGVYDYYLGGTAHRAIDRRFGDQVLTMFPLVRPIARANRSFLRRAVRHLVRCGVRQFVDIGAGMPGEGSTHTIADTPAPGASRVAYVDNDAGAVAHARSLIAESGDPARHAIVHADLRDPDELWRHVGDTGIIDLTEPVGLLMIAVLHLRQSDENGTDVGARAVARYRELLPARSYLAISHATKEDVPDEVKATLAGAGAMYGGNGSRTVWRTRREVTELFGEFELVAPGVTWAPLWGDEESANASSFTTPNESGILAGVARKS